MLVISFTTQFWFANLDNCLRDRYPRLCALSQRPHRSALVLSQHLRFVIRIESDAIRTISLPALAFRSWIGGESAISTYCHSLALAGGKRIAEVMGTSLMDTTETSEFTVNMVNVALPLSDDIPFNGETNVFFQEKLLLEWNCFAATYKHGGKWWTRCSAQIWNEVGFSVSLSSFFGRLLSCTLLS